METLLACGHPGPAHGPRICSHLHESRKVWIEYYQWHTDQEPGIDLLCEDCLQARVKSLRTPALAVCRDCYERFEVDGELQGFGGVALRDRPEPFPCDLVTTLLPVGTGGIVDFAPIDGAGRSLWLLLNEEGGLLRLDADQGETTFVGTLHVPLEPRQGLDRKRRLIVASRGDFAAVVVDYSLWAKMIDLRSGALLLDLDGDDPFGSSTPFPFLFAENPKGETLAIYRAASDRLTVRNLTAGYFLAPNGGRLPPRWPSDDYIHGCLQLSPDGKSVLEDGWAHLPQEGIVRTWSLEPWFARACEQEPGARSLNLCVRKGFWGANMTFVGNDRIAIYGLGHTDYRIEPGARILNLSGPVQSWWDPREPAFPGPTGEFFSDGEVLYSSGPGGLSRWDLEDGCRTGHLPGFEPTRHHRGAGELAQLRDGVLLRWKMPV